MSADASPSALQRRRIAVGVSSGLHRSVPLYRRSSSRPGSDDQALVPMRESRAGAAQLRPALKRLLRAIDRLRLKTHLGPRDHVALQGLDLAWLHLETLTLRRRSQALGAQSSGHAALASDQIAALGALVARTAAQRYRVPNWTAHAAVIWLKLRTLAAILHPVLPEIAERLSAALTGHGPSWPQIEGLGAIRLAAIPLDIGSDPSHSSADGNAFGQISQTGPQRAGLNP